MRSYFLGWGRFGGASGMHPSAGIVRVEALPLCVCTHFETRPRTLCGNHACRNSTGRPVSAAWRDFASFVVHVQYWNPRFRGLAGFCVFCSTRAVLESSGVHFSGSTSGCLKVSQNTWCSISWSQITWCATSRCPKTSHITQAENPIPRL